LSTDRNERRRVVDHLQTERIIGLPQRHEGGAEFVGGRDLALGLRAGENLRRRAGAAAAGERRQRLECGTGAAEMIDEGAKRAWADILAANEPQPIDPLQVLEFSRETTLLLQPCCN
jgi:hypothetical protein